VVDPLPGPAEQRDLAELKEDRSGRRVDQIAAEGDLEDRPVALRYLNQPRGTVAQGVQADPIRGEDLLGIGFDDRIAGSPEDDG
jgi:hypothetical protein